MSNLKYLSVTVNLVNPKSNKTVRFVSSGYTLFFNAQHILLQLSAIERAYFDYLCEQMEAKTNYITVNSKMKEAFIAHISNITSGKNAPSLTSITRYTTKLIRLNLLILMGSKMSEFYCINPKHAFKGKSIQRTTALKQLIETRSKNGLPVNMLIGDLSIT